MRTGAYWPAVISPILFISLWAWAGPSTQLMSHSAFSLSSDALTTDGVWDIDPEEQNPHRARWALKRQVELVGLGPAPLTNGHFGVRTDGIVAKITGYVRPEGPWYKPMSEFGCEEDPVSWFATPEGTKKAATAAASIWDEVVDLEKAKLGVQLKRIAANSGDEAVHRARLLFDAWLKDTEAVWRAKARTAARTLEWEFYLKQGRGGGRCPEGEGDPRPSSSTAVRWDALMESVAPAPPRPFPMPVARAPARRWDGLFSVRVGVEVLGRKLLGQFLVDSGAPVSVLSPAFLRGQGVLPALIEIPHRAPEPAHFSGSTSIFGGALARRATIDRARLSGLELPLREVLIHDTELFAPPENLASCCDGILGMDALRKFVIEFRPGTPQEIVLWPRQGFHPAWVPLADPVWVETAVQIIPRFPGGGFRLTKLKLQARLAVYCLVITRPD